MISKNNLIALFLRICALFCLFSIPSCWEDEQQIRELRQLREKLTLADRKAVESAEAADVARRELSEAATAKADKGIADRLQESQKRISELEAQLSAASQRPAADAPKPANSSSDFRSHAKQVQENLMKQMGVLSDTLQSLNTGTSLEEITVKKIQSGFRSEIVFGVLGGDGQKRNMAFPVEADLDGHWNLPSPAVIAKHLGAVPSQSPKPHPQMAQTPASSPVTPTPAPVANNPASPLPVSNTVVIQWDETPARSAAAAPTARPPTTTQPAAAPVAPAAPTPKPPPAPIMPVTKDVQIRFD